MDSLIKQKTAWSQGSSKYQKQKKCTRSEISINLSFYGGQVIIPTAHCSDNPLIRQKWSKVV